MRNVLISITFNKKLIAKNLNELELITDDDNAETSMHCMDHIQNSLSYVDFVTLI